MIRADLGEDHLDDLLLLVLCHNAPVVDDRLDSLPLKSDGGRGGLGIELVSLDDELVLPGNVVALQLLDTHEPGQEPADRRMDCSVWGGLRAAAAMARGVAGTVADGCYRGVDEQLRVRFPVWGRGRTMMNNHPYVSLAGVNVPVDIVGVRVMPGDLVVADDSGVLFIPSADVERVLDAADRQSARERVMVDALSKGETLEGARRNASG